MLCLLYTSGDTNGSNRLVKKSKFFKEREADETLGENEKNLSSIETIAKCGEETAGNMKKRKYYAFVAADGDSMGKTLEKLVPVSYTHLDPGLKIHAASKWC